MDTVHPIHSDRQSPAASAGDVAAEELAPRAGAAVADLSARTRITLAGNDRQAFLHNLCTNGVASLQPGQGCEAFLLDARGRIVDHVFLHVEPQRIWIDAQPRRAVEILKHLDRYIIREDVHLADKGETWGQLHIAGSRGEAWLADRFDGSLPTGRLDHATGTLAGTICQVRRIERTPFPGFDVLAHRDQIAPVWESLVAGDLEPARRIGPHALESLRIQAGLPAYGLDITIDNFPHETDRVGQAVSFAKGCYLGQETVARTDAMGHANKHLRGVVIASKAPLEPTLAPGTPLRDPAGKEVGRLGSSLYSPSFGAVIGLAMMRRGSDRPGTQVTLEGPNGPLGAIVSALPMQATREQA